MPKIRDLGINGIINAGPSTCSETCPDATAQCEPNSGCAHGSRPVRSAGGALTSDAVAQLKQQLQNLTR